MCSPTPSYSAPVQKQNSHGLSGGAKAGIVVGVAALVLFVVAVLAFFVWRRRRGRKSEGEPEVEGKTSDFEKPGLNAMDVNPPGELGDGTDEKKELGGSEHMAAEREAPSRSESAGSHAEVYEKEEG
jgi:hypothetical protein